MTQATNTAIKANGNLRITQWGIYLFLNRKKDKDCDNCGKNIRKSYRRVSRLVVENKPHAIISYLCHRCQ